jgi:hypothetical protein
MTERGDTSVIPPTQDLTKGRASGELAPDVHLSNTRRGSAPCNPGTPQQHRNTHPVIADPLLMRRAQNSYLSNARARESSR